MNTGLIPVRYATALLQFAHDNNAQDQVYAETKLLAHAFSAHNNFRRVLENPVLDKKEKRKIILTAAGIKVSATFEKFVDLLLANNRESFLQNIALKYIDLYRKSKGILYGKLVTALEVDKTTEQHLVSLVENSIKGKLELEKVVDKSIIGGFQLEVDFVRWDASIKNQLQKIKNEYIERNKRIVWVF